jgi:predicted nucleotidyltransferase
MTRRIVERFKPERIILFGSRARGEAGRHSDFDLLILFRTLDNPTAVSMALYAALWDVRVPKDFVISTTGDFERYRGVVNTIFRAAAREGRTIYERAA